MDDVWAEAFALAEGKDPASSTSKKTHRRDDSNIESHCIGSTKGLVPAVYQKNDPRVQPYLPPITEDQEPFYELQGHLLDNFSTKPCAIYSMNGRNTDERCAVCGCSPGLHLMGVKNPQACSSVFLENPASRLYVALRNLRCSLRAQPGIYPSTTIVQMFHDQVVQLLADDCAKKPPTKKRRKRRQCDSVLFLRSDEKMLEACKEAKDLLLRFPAQGCADKKLVWTIQIIMACDSIYYRLYYADLTSKSPFVIPHPVQYFGGWDSESDPMTNLNLEVSHALERLHVLRMHESHVLFSRLISVQDWSLLSDWQSSCRDFLCHLYGYATLSSNSLQILKDKLQGHLVVEIGAGTGYISRLIGNVIPYDIYPGSVYNEYHAATPLFANVKRGGPRDIADCSALLLCFPPVDNDMASEALEIFLRHKPSTRTRLFVHIGEFRGLTGTPKFESLLTQKLNCLDRMPCLSWGSDTSEISFWEPRSAVGDGLIRSPKHLVTCLQCNNRPAAIRFRYARTLCYCGIECAKLDETTLRVVLPCCFPTSFFWTYSNWEILRAS